MITLNSSRSGTTLKVVEMTNLYLALADAIATNFCFFELKDIALKPKKIILAIVEVWWSILPFQSASKNACNVRRKALLRKTHDVLCHANMGIRI